MPTRGARPMRCTFCVEALCDRSWGVPLCSRHILWLWHRWPHCRGRGLDEHDRTVGHAERLVSVRGKIGRNEDLANRVHGSLPPSLLRRWLFLELPARVLVHEEVSLPVALEGG